MRFDSHQRDASVQFSGYLFAAVIPAIALSFSRSSEVHGRTELAICRSSETKIWPDAQIFAETKSFNGISPQVGRKRLRQRERLEIPRAVAICCRCRRRRKRGSPRRS